MTREKLYYKPCSTCHNDDCVFVGKEDTHEVCEDYQTIKALEQEPKTGHWIPTYGNVKCSVCGSVKDSREVGKATHYCDFCGAKMVEPQESEDKEDGNDD